MPKLSVVCLLFFISLSALSLINPTTGSSPVSKESPWRSIPDSVSKSLEDDAVAAPWEEREPELASSDAQRELESNDGPLSPQDMRHLEELERDAEELLKSEGGLARGLAKLRAAGAMGNARALVTLAKLHLDLGYQGMKDVEKAVRLLRLAQQAGQSDAQALMAFLHATGLLEQFGVERNVGKAILYWKFAAHNDHLPSLMALGYRHLYGIDVSKSCDLAAEYYKKAAKLTVMDERYYPSEELFVRSRPPLPENFQLEGRVRLNHEGDNNPEEEREKIDDELISYYTRAAARGMPDAQATLGVLNLFSNKKRAVDFLAQAARSNHADAHALLGHFALNEYDLPKALRHFRASAGRNSVLGLYGLGMMHLYGLGVQKKDPEKAAGYLHRVATRHPDAAFQLANLLASGKGIEKSEKDARRFWERAAVMGSIPAKYKIGLIFLDESGPGNERECRHAVSYLKEVAEAGEDWSSLIDAARTAYETDHDFSLALYRYLEAAHSGVEVAQHNAAFLCERKLENLRRGSFSNEEEISVGPEMRYWDAERYASVAVEVYEMSGAQGKSQSLVRAGDLTYDSDIQYSIRAYERAAEMSNPEALFNLGWMSSRGLGVEKSAEAAVKYWTEAKRTDPDAFLPAVIALMATNTYDSCKKWLDRFSRYVRMPVVAINWLMVKELLDVRNKPTFFLESVLVVTLLVFLAAIRKTLRRRVEGE